ncbi:MAG: ribosomal large subunit pseudouridine synthase C [Comamonadaceae bacterium BICA1-1]|nr:MAG: ribosomal large subunit pseudouridine synthase C [Comamonadaceae bacterium BICA1-1]
MTTIINNSSAGVRQLVVDAESDGQRLDNYLLRELKGAPKSLIYRVIRSGEVRRNKGRVQADSRVATGDVLRIPPLRLAATDRPEQAEAVPAREFPVLYEDDALLAIDKPAGVAVHGGSGVSFGVIEQLRRARPQAPLLELVHRLDRDTSGILLVAKKRSVLRLLQDQLRQRSMGKTYLALVKGGWPARLKVLDWPLHKYLLPDGERRVRVTDEHDPQGMRSISLVRVLGQLALGDADETGAAQMSTLLAVTIKTGRTHQIRVHLSHAGHPIAGDDKYGDFGWNRSLQKLGRKRMFLHAWQLRFVHPLQGQELQLQAALPRDLLDWADCQRFL